MKPLLAFVRELTEPPRIVSRFSLGTAYRGIVLLVLVVGLGAFVCMMGAEIVIEWGQALRHLTPP